MNLYQYVPNPLSWIEPLGLKCGGVNRRQALNEAKYLAGIPRSQQPNRQWTVGNNPMRRGQTNYKYSEGLGSHGRCYEYTDARGHHDHILIQGNLNLAQTPEPMILKMIDTKI
ncbi:hypothetical protein [Kluyvera sichuanensis]|uniref:hypothetical protein n=1 Tax=Kluyvera sichuanensis TaxID=2725494 RepID=UPI0034A308CF